MNGFSAVLFDLDGTLLDTLADLTDALNHTMSGFGYPSHPTDRVRSFVGNGIYKLVERALPTERRTEEEIGRVYGEFVRYYGVHCAEKTIPYPGIVGLVDDLWRKGIPMSVVSNKDEEMSRTLCERFFPGKFVCVRGGRTGVPKKPDPTGVLAVLQEMGVDPTDVLYVGDSDVDYATARNAGTKVALASWGFRPRADLLALKPDFLADEPDGLRRWILSEK